MTGMDYAVMGMLSVFIVGTLLALPFYAAQALRVAMRNTP